MPFSPLAEPDDQEPVSAYVAEHYPDRPGTRPDLEAPRKHPARVRRAGFAVSSGTSASRRGRGSAAARGRCAAERAARRRLGTCETAGPSCACGIPAARGAWSTLPTAYDDGSFSGLSTALPLS
ncbi:hypothetical protein AQI95_04505 [Streptomyces yokosukanensis]|uniref:Uncharacterized protein n=1 Tax=Streptomyces yokosukanensis TaxID=67386 RepID=A0A117Q5N2_9ACTN|nr:hypothetical protein [Streptomyces yokosukanensis]KUN09584.1 hypothetical protein AQI95_04505 [Streptomyces yokosukanensis]